MRRVCGHSEMCVRSCGGFTSAGSYCVGHAASLRWHHRLEASDTIWTAPPTEAAQKSYSNCALFALNSKGAVNEFRYSLFRYSIMSNRNGLICKTGEGEGKGVIKKWSTYRHGVAHRLGRVIALLFHDRGTRRGWMVSSTPRAALYPRERPGAHFTGGWVGPRAGREERKISSPPGFDPGLSSP